MVVCILYFACQPVFCESVLVEVFGKLPLGSALHCTAMLCVPVLEKIAV